MSESTSTLHNNPIAQSQYNVPIYSLMSQLGKVIKAITDENTALKKENAELKAKQ